MYILKEFVMPNDMRVIPVICLFFFCSGLQAGDLWVTNDSPFPLQAQVYGATGIFEEKVLAPGEQWHWSDQKAISGPSTDPDLSVTPYTVIWYCAKGGLPYGTNTNVAVGAWVSAQASEGPKMCPLPKKKKDGYSK